MLSATLLTVAFSLLHQRYDPPCDRETFFTVSSSQYADSYDPEHTRHTVYADGRFQLRETTAFGSTYYVWSDAITGYRIYDAPSIDNLLLTDVYPPYDLSRPTWCGAASLDASLDFW
jgi:hypothetical protein